jgi:hypothetical protein
MALASSRKNSRSHGNFRGSVVLAESSRKKTIVLQIVNRRQQPGCHMSRAVAKNSFIDSPGAASLMMKFPLKLAAVFRFCGVIRWHTEQVTPSADSQNEGIIVENPRAGPPSRIDAL